MIDIHGKRFETGTEGRLNLSASQIESLFHYFLMII